MKTLKTIRREGREKNLFKVVRNSSQDVHFLYSEKQAKIGSEKILHISPRLIVLTSI